MATTTLWKRLDSLLIILIFLILIAGVYLGLSGAWIAADINKWQMRVMNDHKYFPVLTALLLALPPMLALLPVKMLIKRKLKQN